MEIELLTKHNIPFKPNAKLAEFTTFQLGGPCKVLVECFSAAQVAGLVPLLRANNIPFILMGFGSNILASDEGLQCLVIRFSNPQPIIQRNGSTLIVDAATQMDSLVDFAVNAGLEGLTTFSGIPGTVGGAIAGNAGAYGAQAADFLTKITILKPDNSVAKVPRTAVRFEYRDSDFKHNEDIILKAEFTLKDGDTAAMQRQRAEILSTRCEKHGDWHKVPCAGSFFRNVEPTSKAGPRQSAGWFIEEAGAKALYFGGAHPYHKHGNIITHDPESTALDVYNLTNQISLMVRDKFGISLVREVRLLGAFDGKGNPAGFW